MKISVEMSLYPLSDEFLPQIQDVVERLNNIAGIKVVTNAMSTQLMGEFDQVMAAITREMKLSFQQNNKAVFACKFINSGLDI